MSPAVVVDQHDYDFESADSAPEWLSQFVHNEVRPLLVQHQQAAMEGLARWLAFHADQETQLKTWKARQCKFLEDHGVPADMRDIPDRSAEGLVLIVGGVGCELVDGNPRRTVRGWGSAELHADNEPPKDWPLPPPRNRDLSSDERWAALLAVHDVARDPKERLGPTDCNASYGALYDLAMKLTEAHLPDLQVMLRTATAAAANGEATPAATEQAPGPPPLAAASRESEATGPAKQPAGPPRKQPSGDAFAAYRTWLVTGENQMELAKRLTKELGRPVSQGQVSRWLAQVTEWLETGNVLPELPTLDKKPAAMDPERLDMGQQIEGRTKRQRPQRTDDD